MRGVTLLFAITLFAAANLGCRHRGTPRILSAAAPGPTLPGEPAHPATVTAVRYRTWISSMPGRSFSVGYWQEALWFPEWKVGAWASATSSGEPPALVVFPEEWPHANTVKGAAFIPTGGDPREPYRGPTEKVEVPWTLAQRIRAAGALRAELDRERSAIGPDLAQSGLLREVREDDTRQ